MPRWRVAYARCMSCDFAGLDNHLPHTRCECDCLDVSSLNATLYLFTSCVAIYIYLFSRYLVGGTPSNLCLTRLRCLVTRSLRPARACAPQRRSPLLPLRQSAGTSCRAVPVGDIFAPFAKTRHAAVPGPPRVCALRDDSFVPRLASEHLGASGALQTSLTRCVVHYLTSHCAFRCLLNTSFMVVVHARCISRTLPRHRAASCLTPGCRGATPTLSICRSRPPLARRRARWYISRGCLFAFVWACRH